MSYCERGGSAFWAEPLNAITNGAFLVAALAGLILLLRSGRRDIAAAALVAIVFAIGIGSFLFHTMPGRWTLLADVVPIQLFAFGCFGLVLHRLVGVGLAASLLGTALFVAASFGLVAWLAPLLPVPMRGSAGYASFLIALIGLALYLRLREPAPGAGLLAGAGLVFALSLALRSLDRPLCEAFPAGTHFLWHILNAIVLFLLLKAVIDAPGGRKSERQARRG